MNPSDQTDEILLGIRGDLGRLEQAQNQTNRRLDQTNEHLESLERRTEERFESLVQCTAEGFSHLAGRVDQTNEHLDRMHKQHTEADVRFATEVVALAQDVRGLRDVFVEDRQVRQQVADHERRIQTLERDH